MSQVTWSPQALQDIKRIHIFLARKVPNIAKKAVIKVRSKILFLAEYPESGRPAKNMPSDFREYLIAFGKSGYVVLYYLVNNNLMILAIRHQKEVDYRLQIYLI